MALWWLKVVLDNKKHQGYTYKREQINTGKPFKLYWFTQIYSCLILLEYYSFGLQIIKNKAFNQNWSFIWLCAYVFFFSLEDYSLGVCKDY